MSEPVQPGSGGLHPTQYWWLWLFDTVLMTAGMWFYLATHYATLEFFWKACAMALLPLLPLLVLVGGGGSTVFALTKVWGEKRGLKKTPMFAALVAPAVILTLALVLFGVNRSPANRLKYVCLGQNPPSATNIQVAGYSTFLHGEWLGVFNVSESDFKDLITRIKLEPDPGCEFNQKFEFSILQSSRAAYGLSQLGSTECFKRVFAKGDDTGRGSVFVKFDPATSTAVVYRVYRD